MNDQLTTGAAVLLAICLILIFLPPRFDPAIRLKEKLSKTLTPEQQQKRDCDEINAGRCPDCGKAGSLLQGPSGGMSQNIACDNCLSEFNVGMGFGTGAFMVDRMGKLGFGRARLYGIPANQVAESLDDPQP